MLLRYFRILNVALALSLVFYGAILAFPVAPGFSVAVISVLLLGALILVLLVRYFRRYGGRNSDLHLAPGGDSNRRSGPFSEWLTEVSQTDLGSLSLMAQMRSTWRIIICVLLAQGIGVITVMSITQIRISLIDVCVYAAFPTTIGAAIGTLWELRDPIRRTPRTRPVRMLYLFSAFTTSIIAALIVLLRVVLG